MKKLSWFAVATLGGALQACAAGEDTSEPLGGGSFGGDVSTGGAMGFPSGGATATTGGWTGGTEPSGGSGGLLGSGGFATTGGTSTTGGASNSGGTDGTGAVGGLEPVSCPKPFADPSDYTSGLPLLRSNPNAGLVLFVDFDGGTYGGSEQLSAYYTGTATQRANIVASFNHLVQYFAMFDLSVTTDVSNIGAGSGASNWGWAVVSPGVSGGSGKYNGIGKLTYGNAKCGSASVTGSDRSRRIAHELGHNMNLYHDGLYEVPGGQDLSTGANPSGGVCTASDSLCFFKFEDSKGWDGAYGSIMGGGGEGDRNGWGLALFDPERGGSNNPGNLQDSMAKIRAVVRNLGGSTSNDGWALDDHPDGTPSPLCIDANGNLYRVGVLGSPSDVDVFSLIWPGGTLVVDWSAPGVSAALVDLDIYRNGVKVGDSSVSAASAGVYEIRVRSQGSYGAIGYYNITIN